MRVDQESLFQHMLVFGGTGEGKTTALLKPLIRQLLRQKSYGMYVCDAKGVLWNDVAAVVRQERPGVDAVIIGTGANQSGVDLLAGLTPTQVAGTLRSVMTQLSGGSGGDTFWPDMAATVLRNMLSLARAYSYTEPGKAAARKDGAAPYSLWWAYQALLRPELMAEAMSSVSEWVTKATEKIRNATSAAEVEPIKPLYMAMTSREVYDSITYLGSAWRDMAKETKSGIVANVTQLLDGFAGANVLRERFACGNSAQTISIAEALNGKVVLNALSSIEDGLPARIVNVLLKTNLYREARRREAAYRQGTNKVKPQDQPCMVVMDEVQEIVDRGCDFRTQRRDVLERSALHPASPASSPPRQWQGCIRRSAGKRPPTSCSRPARRCSSAPRIGRPWSTPAGAPESMSAIESTTTVTARASNTAR